MPIRSHTLTPERQAILFPWGFRGGLCELCPGGPSRADAFADAVERALRHFVQWLDHQRTFAPRRDVLAALGQMTNRTARALEFIETPNARNKGRVAAHGKALAELFTRPANIAAVKHRGLWCAQDCLAVAFIDTARASNGAWAQPYRGPMARGFRTKFHDAALSAIVAEAFFVGTSKSPPPPEIVPHLCHLPIALRRAKEDVARGFEELGQRAARFHDPAITADPMARQHASLASEAVGHLAEALIAAWRDAGGTPWVHASGRNCPEAERSAFQNFLDFCVSGADLPGKWGVAGTPRDEVERVYNRCFDILNRE